MSGAEAQIRRSPVRPRGARHARRAATAPALLVGAALAVSGCALPGSGPQAQLDRPPSNALLDARAPEPRDAGQNTELTRFYAEVEGGLTASGRMRRETAPSDAPYSVDDLVRNFERIALYDEYVEIGGRFIRSETPSYLRRWGGPVRVGVMTGPSVPVAEASRDRANVAGFTSRLARLTGHDMRMGREDEVNFLVLFMNDAERGAFAREVSSRYPGFAPSVMEALRDTPLDTFCTAYAFGDPLEPANYAAVMILIRAEHPPLTRLSCVHEEMAQAMGLPNDSPDARPSLFNDSLEFALLTEHDEVLLRMLYDPRLRPGMTVAEARPLLPGIARDAIDAQLRDKGAGAVALN